MKRFVIIVTLCVGCYTAVNAQTFTQRLQQSKSGEGKVTITQDKAIEDLVNGPKDQKTTTATTTSKPDTGTTQRTTVTPPTQKTTATPLTTPKTTATPLTPPKTTAAPQSQQPDTTVTASGETTIRKKVIKGGYKVNGFRVQVYAGGNSRNARIKAERTGREINALFPGQPVYVHFYSPRWICRMGNYRTYEEASEVLRAVKKLGYQSAIIVKGQITVPYVAPAEESDTLNPSNP